MEEGHGQTNATPSSSSRPTTVPPGTGRAGSSPGGSKAVWTSPYASLVIAEPRPISSSLPTPPLIPIHTTTPPSTLPSPRTATVNQDWTSARLGITTASLPTSTPGVITARRSSDDPPGRTPTSEELALRRGSEPAFPSTSDTTAHSSSRSSLGTWSHSRASTSPASSLSSPSSASTLAPPTPTLASHTPMASSSATSGTSFRMTRSTSFGSTPSPTSTTSSTSSTSFATGYPAANGRWIRDSDSSSICSSSSSRSTGAGSNSSYTFPHHGGFDKVRRSNSFGTPRPVVEVEDAEGGAVEESVDGEGEGEVYKLRDSSIPDFLDPRPDPLGVELSISRDDPAHIVIRVSLPGFELTNITVAMRRGRRVHIVADRWGDGGGHFEKLISLGPDVSSSTPRAEFNGTILLVYIARRLSQSSRPKSESAPRPLSSTVVGPEAAKAAAKKAKEEATRRAKEDASHLPKPLVSPRLPTSSPYASSSPSTFAQAFEEKLSPNPWDSTPGWEGKGLERNGTVTRENYVRGNSDQSVSTVSSHDSGGSAGESVTGSVAESVGSQGSTDPIHPRHHSPSSSFTSLDPDDQDPFSLVPPDLSPPILSLRNPPSPPLTTIATTAPTPRPSYLKNPQNLTLRPTDLGTTFLEAVASGLKLGDPGEETPRGEKEEFVHAF